MTAPAPTWDEFAEALTYELSALGSGVLFVISVKGRPWQFAQFAQHEDALLAEVSGHTVEDPPGTNEETQAERERLAALGWQPPVPREGYHWHRRVAYPPTSREYAEIVDGVVRALREVNGVATPTELSFRAWDGSTPGNDDWEIELPGVERQAG
ncbi:TY-Chap domain-containing protein [Dactylosporangium sp. CA-233914]|uniref:TY-Chap domain-containing protein n=1 Tax=Dactylosporangium sp. CA-233914 TaxID=3239934 RepID=UPI003D8B92E8